MFFSSIKLIDKNQIELVPIRSNVEFFSFKKGDQLFIDFWFEDKKESLKAIVKTKVLKIKESLKRKRCS